MKASLVFCLIALLVAHTYAQCVITSTVASFGTSCTSSGGCSLSATLLSSLNSNLACAVSALLGGVNLVLAPTGSGTLNIQLSATGFTYTSLNITANTGVVINAVAATMNIANALVLAGDTTLQVASGTVVTVGTNVQVQAGATLNVAGNVTANSAIAVEGTVQFAGTRVATAAQNAWVALKNTDASASISFSGTSTIRGNGGFDGSVNLAGNASVQAGNSPGTVFVNGNLDMDPFTTLQIDVDSRTDFDLLIIQKAFNRDGILYARFENNYVPNKNEQFIFATHASASGEFKVFHGNYLDKTANKVRPNYGGQTTSFTYSSASSVAASLFFILVCSLIVL